METILTDVKEGVLTVTLNRPDVLNSMNGAMAAALLAAMAGAASNPDVRAVLLTGALSAWSLASNQRLPPTALNLALKLPANVPKPTAITATTMPAIKAYSSAVTARRSDAKANQIFICSIMYLLPFWLH